MRDVCNFVCVYYQERMRDVCNFVCVYYQERMRKLPGLSLHLLGELIHRLRQIRI